MKPLEEEIREYLINRRAEDNYEMMQQPEFKKIVDNLCENIFKSLYSEDEEFEEMKSEVDKFLKEFYSDHERLKVEAYKNARNNWATKEQLESQLNVLYEAMEEDFDSELIQEVKEMTDSFCNKATHKNNIIGYLVEIAETEGLETALTEEKYYEATKEIFPTEEEFVSYNMEMLELAKEYMGKIQDIMLKDGFEGKMASQILGGLTEGLEKELVSRLVQKEAEKIYS